MGFTEQPPLSSLGSGGGFVPGAPPPTAPLTWISEKRAQSPSTTPAHAQPALAPTAFVPSVAGSPSTPMIRVPQPANVTMFNPGTIAHEVAPVALGPSVSHTSASSAPLAYAAPPSVHVAPASAPASSPSASTVTTLRGRERYCSGGAWVGPAAAWPKPPPTATLENADVSRVRQNHLGIVRVLREKYHEAMQGAPPARLKELEGISNKLGGLFVFLNNTGASVDENAVTDPVAEALVTLSESLASNNTPMVNSVLLHLSQRHWEEVSYWFPALKRLARFAAER